MSDGFLGFPQPGPPSGGGGTVYNLGSSPFDIKAVSDSIDRAASSLKPEERLAITLQLQKNTGFGAGLIVRGPSLGRLKSEGLATVTKPVAGRWGWSLSGRVAFLKAQPAPEPVRIAPDLRGAYQLFRHRGSNPLAAAMKALALVRGDEVRLDG